MLHQSIAYAILSPSSLCLNVAKPGSAFPCQCYALLHLSSPVHRRAVPREAMPSRSSISLCIAMPWQHRTERCHANAGLNTTFPTQHQAFPCQAELPLSGASLDRCRALPGGAEPRLRSAEPSSTSPCLCRAAPGLDRPYHCRTTQYNSFAELVGALPIPAHAKPCDGKPCHVRTWHIKALPCRSSA